VKSYDFLREIKKLEVPASSLDYDLAKLEGEETQTIEFEAKEETLKFVFVKREVIGSGAQVWEPKQPWRSNSVEPCRWRFLCRLREGTNLYLYEKERYDQTYRQARNEMSRLGRFEKSGKDGRPLTAQEFLASRKATQIFAEEDAWFVRGFLMLFKPRPASDQVGYVYVYHREADDELVE